MSDSTHNNHRETAELRKKAKTMAFKFRVVARDLDNHCTKLNIAKVTGGCVGTVGGVVAGIGLVLIPFTGGLSAVVAAAGGLAAGAAGGLTAAIAKIVQMVVESNTCEELIKEWDLFCTAVKQNVQHNPDLARREETLLGNAGQLGFAATGGATAVVAKAARGGVGVAAARLTAALAAGSVVLNAMLVGLSIHDIVRGSIGLHLKEGSLAGIALRKMADNLENYADTGEWDI